MFLPILSISFLLLLSTSLPGVYGICDETEFSCSFSTESSCSINVDNATRASSLIKQCTAELVQDGIYYIEFYVHLQEENEILLLDIAAGISTFYMYVSDSVSIEFNKTQSQVLYLYFRASSQATVSCQYDFMNYFPAVSYLYLYYVTFDRFPYFNSTSLARADIYYIKLPNVVTILPSMLVLPHLDLLVLYQLEDAQWYNLISSSLDNTRIFRLYLRGVQQLYSNQFAMLTGLTRLHIENFFTNFTFEESSLAGLDKLQYLHIRNLQTNLDFISNETFPSLITLDLRYSTITTLNQKFFERQKELLLVYGYSNQFHCGCEMAWISYVETNLDWEVSGTCKTPASLYGNSVSDSSNYISCPNNQSYHCFNDSLICPQNSICVNTADSAYCDCGEGNECEDINECSSPNNCEQICTNSVGSYTCSCMPGFSLQSDSLSCVSGVSQLTAQALIALISLLLQISLL